MPMARISRSGSAARLLAATCLAAVAVPAFAQGQQPTPPTRTPQGDQTVNVANSTPPNDDQRIVITGFRRSLQSSTNAKREAVGFTDTIFAEDIGKFPDTNIAES